MEGDAVDEEGYRESDMEPEPYEDGIESDDI
jgi:hypothetical protein